MSKLKKVHHCDYIKSPMKITANQGLIPGEEKFEKSTLTNCTNNFNYRKSFLKKVTSQNFGYFPKVAFSN